MEIICYVIYTNLIIGNPEFLFKLITSSSALLSLLPASSITCKKRFNFRTSLKLWRFKNSIVLNFTKNYVRIFSIHAINLVFKQLMKHNVATLEIQSGEKSPKIRHVHLLNIQMSFKVNLDCFLKLNTINS